MGGLNLDARLQYAALIGKKTGHDKRILAAREGDKHTVAI